MWNFISASRRFLSSASTKAARLGHWTLKENMILLKALRRTQNPKELSLLYKPRSQESCRKHIKLAKLTPEFLKYASDPTALSDGELAALALRITGPRKRFWAPVEDEALMTAAAQHLTPHGSIPDDCWHLIAADCPERPAHKCKKRLSLIASKTYKASPKRKEKKRILKSRRKWTTGEVERLHVLKCAPEKYSWQVIAEKLGTGRRITSIKSKYARTCRNWI